jgi:hypothetical protein
MKKIIFSFLLLFSGLLIYGQPTKNSLSDPDIKTKLQKVRENMDHLLVTFKTDKQPDPDVNFDNSYYTNLEFFKVKGTISSNDFDEDMSFRISSSDNKKASRADFEKAYEELADNLKTIFDFLEIREKQGPDMKELTLFEAGKNTDVPVADPRSPKYYINVKFNAEMVGKATSYSIFLYFTSKKKS